jgi:peptide/nickel transport system ATP-binding protein
MTLHQLNNNISPVPNTTPNSPALRVDGLKAYYQTRWFGITREVRAVDDITLRIEHDEIYGIAGESSSGKSSLIKTIAGAIRPPLNVVSGSVNFDFGTRKVDLYALKPAERTAIRWKHLAYIMQGSMSVLNPLRRVRASFVDFAFRHMGLPMPAFLRAVEEHLLKLHLQPGVLDSYPHELSGGMRQRVSIALSLLLQPELIILDEPTTALDIITQRAIIDVIRNLREELDFTMIFISHDLSLAAELADRVATMYAGEVVEYAPVRDVFYHPKHPYSVGLMNAVPPIAGEEFTPLVSIPGSTPNLLDLPSGCPFHPRCPWATEICVTEHPPLEEVGPMHWAACHHHDEVDKNPDRWEGMGDVAEAVG